MYRVIPTEFIVEEYRHTIKFTVTNGIHKYGDSVMCSACDMATADSSIGKLIQRLYDRAKILIPVEEFDSAVFEIDELKRVLGEVVVCEAFDNVIKEERLKRTLSDAKSCLKKLEHDIADMLSNYCHKFDLEVDNVQLNKVSMANGKDCISGVKCRVRL